MRTLSKANIRSKTVLVRVDFNVPLNKSANRVLDDSRVKASLPTIKHLLKNKNKIILLSHLGRPKGKKVKNLSLKPVARRLEKLLRRKVSFGCLDGDIVLLENVRFSAGEEKNSKAFAKGLASLADVYVNDAFGTCHRKHASVHAITNYLPSYAGLLIENEVKHLSEALKPKKPAVFVMGGGKVKSKLPLLKSMLPKVDYVLLGSAIFYGLHPRHYNKKIIMPVDLVPVKGKPRDIGPNTIKLFKKKLKGAKTIIWNGPMGYIETKKFAKGSIAIARAIANSKAKSYVGGGETVELIDRLKIAKKFTHISTGGGASITFLSGKKLPGLEALK